jgi:hypothetical protein
MALPDNVLSTTAVVSTFVGARAQDLPRAPVFIDKEDGGVAIGDASQGHRYQEWRAIISGDGTEIAIEADSAPPSVLYSGAGITEVSLSFDQNMRPALAFVEGGVAKLQWFDTQVGQQVVTEYPGASDPRIILDDKRVWQTQNNDLIFAYIRNGALYYRQQRDRYTIERLLLAQLPEGTVRFEKMVFGANYRLHFVFVTALRPET